MNDDHSENEFYQVKEDSSVQLGSWYNYRMDSGSENFGITNNITYVKTEANKFDTNFESSTFKGIAMVLNKGLQKDVAEYFNIDKSRPQQITFDPETGERILDVQQNNYKEVTIALLDGSYSNKIDVIHFKHYVEILPKEDQQIENLTATVYYFDELIL